MKCSKCGSRQVPRDGACKKCGHIPYSRKKPVSKDLTHLKLDVHPDYQLAISELKEWVDKVAEELLENAKGTIKIGFEVEAGQQFILGFKSERFDHPVIRAYVHAEGYPITLSFSGN